MRKWMNLVNEDCLTKGEIKKGTWTYWQDRDGIFVCLPGSNSCFAGFCSQDEALHFAAEQGPEWQVVRWGKFKTMSDAEALADYDVRRDRMRHGFYVGPLAEDAEVEEGTVLNLAVSEGKVIATPVKKHKQSLKQMLAKVSRKNLHSEVESGAPVGREVW